MIKKQVLGIWSLGTTILVPIAAVVAGIIWASNYNTQWTCTTYENTRQCREIITEHSLNFVTVWSMCFIVGWLFWTAVYSAYRLSDLGYDYDD